MNEQYDAHVKTWRSIEYWMKHPGYEILAGEPRYVTDEIIRRLLLLEHEDE